MTENSNPKRLVRLAVLAGGGTAAAGVALTAALTVGVSHSTAATTTTHGTTSTTTGTTSTTSNSTDSGSDSTGGLSSSTQDQAPAGGSNGS
ncbi:MAG: hypothetical protein ACRDWT_04850 [Jatrophihabitantaceae bacterium]